VHSLPWKWDAAGKNILIGGGTKELKIQFVMLSWQFEVAPGYGRCMLGMLCARVWHGYFNLFSSNHSLIAFTLVFNFLPSP